MKLLLVGTGYMAREYAKVLQALGVDFDVVGRGEPNCSGFREAFPTVNVISGGIEKFTLQNTYTKAIVASSVESLYANTAFLITKGIKTILLEKPGGKTKNEINDLAQLASANRASVLLGYNRRFYSSVLKAREIIDEDGGVLSFNFEFTEWAHTIEPLQIDNDVKQNWFLANSTHVADTAFFLGGKPKEFSAYFNGALGWHARASCFSGAGKTTRGALFSYLANWQAPGRWSVEIMTNKHRLILRPMESLQIQQMASVAIDPVEVDADFDKKFKPGLFLQTKAFLANEWDMFCDINEQKTMVNEFYVKMSGY